MTIRGFGESLIVIAVAPLLSSCGEVRYQSPEQQAQCTQLQQEERRDTHGFVKKSELHTTYTRLFGQNVLKNAAKLSFSKDEDVKRLTKRIHADAVAECAKLNKEADCRSASAKMQSLYVRSTDRRARFKMLECPGELKSN